MPAAAACGAETFHQVLHLVKLISLGIPDGRDVNTVKAECLMAGLTVEMAMQFIRAAFMVVAADAVFPGATSVLDLMHQMMLCKSLQRPEDRGLVNGVQGLLQVSQAERVMELQH